MPHDPLRSSRALRKCDCLSVTRSDSAYSAQLWNGTVVASDRTCQMIGPNSIYPFEISDADVVPQVMRLSIVKSFSTLTAELIWERP